MTDSELAAELLRLGHLGTSNRVPCPCGVMRSIMPAFHKRMQNHDCVHHPRRSCGTCRAADRMLASVDARLKAETAHGPFIVTKWDT